MAMRVGETPVPIPNTKVKTYAADGTALETVWESRWLPAPNQKHGEMLIEHRTGTHRSVPTWYSGGSAVKIAGLTSDQRLGGKLLGSDD